jgi:hypothetical protein
MEKTEKEVLLSKYKQEKTELERKIKELEEELKGDVAPKDDVERLNNQDIIRYGRQLIMEQITTNGTFKIEPKIQGN